MYEERCKAYDMEVFEPTTENGGLDELEGLWLPLLSAECLESYTCFTLILMFSGVNINVL